MKHPNRARRLVGNLLKYVTGLILLLSLYSCGFQLRGTQTQFANTPISIQLSNELPRDWQIALDQQLLRSKITVSDTAALHLKLSSFTEEKRVVALNQRAKASEYEILIGFSYVILKHEMPLAKKARLSASRSYEFLETQVVGKAHEETLIRSQLRQQLFRRLMQQLRRAAHHAD